MSQQSRLVFSNQVEELFNAFYSQAFVNTELFTKRLVVVPSPAMRAWLQETLAAHCGIATGIEFIYLRQLVDLINNQTLVNRKGQSVKAIPTQQTLTFAIEAAIHRLFDRRCSMGNTELSCWQPLFHYLHATADCAASSTKFQRRLSTLCQKLAVLFGQYGEYGERVTFQWREEGLDTLGWQERLFVVLFQENPDWALLSDVCAANQRILADTSVKDLFVGQWQVHIFALSFVPQLYQRFFEALAKQVPITHYVLSPTLAFWGDVCSDREAAQLSAFWQRKDGNAAEQDSLEDLLRDRNRLLGNLGRLGRRYSESLGEYNLQQTDAYRVHPLAAVNPVYQDLLPLELQEDGEVPLNLLTALQTDWLAMRSPEENNRLFLDGDSGSIQIHSVPSRLREVQVLYDRVTALVAESQNDGELVRPEDIVVMAPNISDYEAYLKMVFSNDESPFDVRIIDLPLQGHSAIVNAFVKLLDIGGCRWEAPALLELFDFPGFQRATRMGPDDVAVLRRWIEETGLVWGEDPSHRNILLLRSGCDSGLLDGDPAGTWSWAFDTLVRSLVTIAEDSDKGLFSMPVVSTTEAELLGRWIRVLRSLRDDLQVLAEGPNLSLDDWSFFLSCLLETYVAPDPDSRTEKQDYATLQGLCQGLSTVAGGASHYFAGFACSFISIRNYIDTELVSTSRAYQESQASALRCCSMLPMRAIPAKAVFLMGMEDGVYPRTEASQSLNLLSGNSLAEDCPSRSEYDRYLFLEAILSARYKLNISFCSINLETGAEQQPSLVVKELLSYLDQAFRVCNTKPSEYVLIEHPKLPVDPLYFDLDRPELRCQSPSRYHAAQAYWSRSSAERKPFVPSWENVVVDKGLDASEQIISLASISHVARQPLSAFLQRSLGIYLETESSWEMPRDEPFVIPPLLQAVMRRQTLQRSAEDVWKEAKERGRVPTASFGDLAWQHFSCDVEQWQSTLSALGVRRELVFDVVLDEHCSGPQQRDASTWEFPAFRCTGLRGTTYCVVGSLRDITPQGLLSHGKVAIDDLAKAWPQFLLLSSLRKLYPGVGPIGEQNLLLTKAGKVLSLEDSCLEQTFSRYLDYAATALASPSPLLPEWLAPLITKDSAQLEAKIRQIVDDSRNNPDNWNAPYLQCLFNGAQYPDASMLIRGWHTQADSLFADAIDRWFPKLAVAKETTC